MSDVLQILDDGCDHGHYYKFSDRLVDTEDKGSDESSELNPLVEKKGHPFPCASGCCTSWLRILRAAAEHLSCFKNSVKQYLSCQEELTTVTIF